MYGKRFQIYLPDSYDKSKLDRLAKHLQAQGVDLSDGKRSNAISLSRMFRYLVDAKVKEIKEE